MSTASVLAAFIPGGERRSLWFAPPAPAPGIGLVGFEGDEALSRPFSFILTLRRGTGAPSVDSLATAWIGRDVGFGLESVARGDFHGVALAVQQEDDGNLRLEVGPRLALLRHSARCRTFVGKTVRQIAEEIFAQNGLTDYQFRLGQRSYAPREVCVQYRESDASFLMRLFEEEGVFFFFEFARGRHTLVLSDHSPALVTGKPAVVAMRDHDALTRHDAPGLDHWQWRRGLAPGAATMAGHTPAMPRANLLGRRRNDAALPAERACRLDLGLMRVGSRDEAEALAEIGLQAEESSRTLVHGSGGVCLRPGQVFLRAGATEPFLVRAVRHSAQEGDDGRAGGYGSSFEAQPAHTPFRPARRTLRPAILGWHPAVVVGRDGKPTGADDIVLDEQHRVRIHFRWDPDEGPDHAIPCRVEQTWPGMFGPPRLGQEVAVDFEEGDPDRPLVRGLLPTTANLLPHDPARHPAAYTLRLPASPPGGKDTDTVVQADTAAGKQRLAMQVPGNLFKRVTGEMRTWVGKLFSLEVLGAFFQKVARSFHLQAGEEIVLQAGKKLVLRVGGSVLVISEQGISLDGKMIYINSPGGPTAGAIEEPRPPEKPY